MCLLCTTRERITAEALPSRAGGVREEGDPRNDETTVAKNGLKLEKGKNIVPFKVQGITWRAFN